MNFSNLYKFASLITTILAILKRATYHWRYNLIGWPHHSTIKSSIRCLQSNVSPVEPATPSYPFKAVAFDYFDSAGQQYLIKVDRFSNWPEVINIKPGANTSGTSGLFALLKSYFAKFGVPVVLSDDGPEFIANRANSCRDRESNTDSPQHTIPVLIVVLKSL